MAVDQAAEAVRNASSTLQNALAKRTNGADSLGKDDFLKMMMAQMTNQDPLNPMDSQGMMDQVTAMGSLEQLMNVNKNLDSLRQVQHDIARANVFSFLNKDVTVPGGRVSLEQGRPTGMAYDLPREAEKVRVTISDAGGNEVRQLELGPQAPGPQQVQWDALDADGQPLPDGRYNYDVTALTADAERVPVELFTHGKVAGVRFADGRPLLKVNGEELDIGDVVEMSDRSQRRYGAQQPFGLRETLQPQPPITEAPAPERER